MPEDVAQLREWLLSDRALAVYRAIAVMVGGLILTWMVRRKVHLKHLRPQQQLMFRRILSVVVLGIAVTWSLSELGLNLSVLLGAAGILTVAIGFASQTSASNIISGFFLMGEQPFQIGDLVAVDQISGEVLSIDLLSVKVRTFDNLQVRIPNETMLKTNVTTLTRFPLRRIDLKIGIAYKEDIGRAREILFTVADRNPLCMEEPPPLFIFLGYGNSSLDFQFSVWAATPNFLLLRNTMYEEVKQALDQADIEIPFPHVSLYTGEATSPMPIQIVPPPPAAPK